jgi:hypothetical protein
MMLQRCAPPSTRLAVLFALALSASVQDVHAAKYAYKTIVEQSPTLTFDTLGNGFRQLNDAGEVVYQATSNVQNFVFKRSGASTITIAGPPAYFGLNSGYGNGAIADNGSVVFSGSFMGNDGGNYNGIFLGSGGGASPVLLSAFDPNTDLPERLPHAASTSPSGLIAFLGSRYDFPDQGPDESNSGYYLLNGSTVITLAEDGGTYTSVAGGAPVVNNAGQVAFLMGVNTGTGSSRTILRYDDGSLTTIKSDFFGGSEIWMNSSGDVVYADATHVSLYSGGVTTTIADTDDGFNSLMKSGNADVFINDAGDVAFWGNVTEFNGNPVTWQGIYTGPDVINDRVLVFGDSILGHVVSGIELLGLNNAGQLLFSVDAQSPDTWRALVLATPLREADFEEDGDVDGADLDNWTAGYGPAAIHTTGDADGDGDADGGDFLIWQQQLNAPATLAVPEPAALALIVGWVLAPTFPRRGRGRFQFVTVSALNR